MRTRRIRTGAVAAIAGLTLVAAACGSDNSDSNSSATTSAAAPTTVPESATTMAPETTESMSTEPMTTESMTTESMAADEAALEPMGPACSSVPADGEGSFAGMADDPAATAASNNPELTTLVEAVTAANL